MQVARAEMLVLLFVLSQCLGGIATGGFYPDDCSPSACPAFVTWTPDLSNGAVLFHLESTTTGWVAVGLSDDQKMGTAGIDDVLSCQLSVDSNSTVYAKDMWNPEDQTTLGKRNEINDNQYAIKMLEYSYINGRLQCNFTRLIITNNTKQDRHLNGDWYILLAHGHERGIPDSHFTEYHGHANRFFSDNRVNVSSSNGSSAVTDCGVGILEQVHGICMFISFGVLIPLGIFFAAYMKQPLAQHGAWFQVHRALMLLSIPLTIVGFVVIFVSNSGFMQPLGASNPKGTAHMVIGFVLVMLQFLNPILGFFRPKLKSKWRPVFYVIHAIVIGYVLELLGAVNISLGLTVFAELLDISALQNRPFWVWVASMVVYGAVDAAAFVHRLASRKRKEEQDKEALLLQKKTNEAPKASYVQWTLFTAAVTTLAFFGASIITLLITTCSPQK